MKAGFLDQLIEACGWVVGRTLIFFAAVALGAGIGVTSMYFAGMFDGAAEEQSYAGFFSMTFVGSILLQFGLIFITALWWVRSEKTGMKSWCVIASAVAVDVGALYGNAGPPFWRAWMWFCIGISIYGIFRSKKALIAWEVERGELQIQALKAENAARREDLHQRFGTVNSGSDELGMAE